MALVDKYGNFSLAMLLAILPGLSIDKLRLVLRFAEFLAEIKEKRLNE
ncbi:hypothetical protein ES706_06588 [subsurface metagenome]